MALVRTVRVICLVAGLFMILLTVTVALAALPLPAAGGTCGPGTSSESAVQAFFDPVSIGAGARPTTGSGALAQWQAFVHQCQTATDNRMIVVGALLVGALLILFGAPWLIGRAAHDDPGGAVPGGAAAGTAPGDTPPDGASFPPPGWYPDPVDPATARWWDGRTWGVSWTPPT